MNRRWGLICLILIILGVFAYSAFINLQPNHNPGVEKSVGY